MHLFVWQVCHRFSFLETRGNVGMIFKPENKINKFNIHVFISCFAAITQPFNCVKLRRSVELDFEDIGAFVKYMLNAELLLSIFHS